MKTIYLIRHGETDFNKKGIVQGSGVDSNLNDFGKRQAQAFFEMYKDIPFDKIYTSTLKRTIQSIEPFLDLGLRHEQHSGLNEISWGIHEGQKVSKEDHKFYLEMLEKWKNGDPTAKIEGGESPLDVQKRQKEILDLILFRKDEAKILVAMHGRAMRILLCHLLNYPLNQMDTFEHQNLCLYKIIHTGTMFVIEKFCDVEHLNEL